MAKKRPKIVEKTYYVIHKAAYGTVRDKNVEDLPLISEELDDVNWYMEHVLHVKSEGMRPVNLDSIEPATKADKDFCDKIKPGQYYIAVATVKFGRGYNPITTIDKIKDAWKKIHEYYKDV